MSAFAGLKVVVAGAGISGVAVARALSGFGAAVTVVDDQPRPEHLDILTALDIPVIQRGDEVAAMDLAAVDLLVTSPGWQPTHPLLARAIAADVELIGDVELAWRIDQERSARDGTAAPAWLAVTGTNGKTTTVGMLASILKASGRFSAAAGNVGYSLVDAVLAEPRFEVLAVELSSFQLHWSQSIAPHAGAVINIAEDHLDWHGSMDAYADAKISLLRKSQTAIVNVDDSAAVHYASEVIDPIAVTRDIPRPGELGVVEDLIVDRAFVDPSAAEELATLADITPAAPHNITNALVAAALARSIGVRPGDVAAGLRGYRSDGHRIEYIATIAGVDFIDDSKATNPHAAQASIAAFSSVVWVAGGLAKGARMEELVESVAPRLKGAVLIGADRQLIHEALQRHAPHLPVRLIDGPDTGQVHKDDPQLMRAAVAAAADLAEPGDTVLLAPACASMDQFTSYAHRGRLFAAAVKERA